MPSYTFSSTANAFVLRGAVPVFLDITLDTCNIDVSKIEQAITPKTKAIIVVHYGGVGCDMEKISAIAKKHHLFVVAQPPADIEHNGHLFYLIFPSDIAAADFIQYLGAQGITAVSHYVPLHSAPAGFKFGRADGELANTEIAGKQLVRLPLWVGLEEFQDKIINTMMSYFGRVAC